MTDFVYDNSSLPEGKADAATSPLPTANKITAAEWNTLAQAVKDLRAAITAGKYHGLATAPSESVSAAGGVKLRNNAGKFEVSENGGAFVSPSNVFNVKAYGASGDGVTDDAAAIQAAVAAAQSAGGKVYLPAGTYKVNTELTISGTNVAIEGAGQTATVIKAGATIASVLACSGGGGLRVANLTLHGNSLATNAARVATGCSLGFFEKVTFTYATGDGFYYPQTGISDTNTFEGCNFVFNGTLYRSSGIAALGTCAIETVVSGTVAVAAASPLALVGTGTAFTSMGIRRGDFIAVGVAPLVEFLQIHSVTDDTHLVLEDTTPTTLTRSAQPFYVGVGDGYHESYGAPDANINRIKGGLVRANAGQGLVFGGQSGPRVEGVQIDTQSFYGIAVGHWSLSTNFGGSFTGVYFEDCRAGGFHFGYAIGVTVIGSTDTGLGPGVTNGQVVTTPPKWRSYPGKSTGLWLGSSLYSDPSGYQVGAIGAAASNVGPTQTVVGGTFAIAAAPYFASEGVTAIAGTSINPSSYKCSAFMLLGGDTTMTATPQIVAGTNGQLIMVSNNTAGYTLTLQAEDYLAGASLRLCGHHQLKLAQFQCALLMYTGGENCWHLIGTTGALIDVADSTGTPGNATQNTLSGRVSVAAAGTAVTITNSKITTGSKVFVQLQSVDATAKSAVAVCAANTITITLNAAATGTVNVAWSLVG